MFSLIISIISIALVAALAAATVYFGGAAFNKGSAGADASAFVNAGQQISGAFTLASADNFTFAAPATPTVAELAPDYLAQIPTYKGTSLDLDDTTGYVSATVSADVCKEVNKRAFGTETNTVTALTATAGGLYGCLDASTEAYYKAVNK